MTRPRNPGAQCLIDGCSGIYIPQAFYRGFDFAACGLNIADYGELSDPDNETYWETWDEVLDKATWNEPHEADKDWIVEWCLYQDGDLFALPYRATHKVTGESVQFSHNEFFGEPCEEECDDSDPDEREGPPVVASDS